MKDVLEQLHQELTGGRDAVLLTVIDSKGSAPRHAGSHQLVLTNGTTVGTIGGGIAEYKACEAGKGVLKTGTSRIISYILHPNGDDDIGAVCGGETTVFCQFISAADTDTLVCVEKILDARKRRKPCHMVIDVTRPAQWAMAVVGDEIWFCGEPTGRDEIKQCLSDMPAWLRQGSGMIRESGISLYREPISYAGHVYVFGGGHVAQALVPILTQVGFSCRVIDDREEFANPQRFPHAEKTIVADLRHISPVVHITAQDYVCIMTRGHVGDYEVERQVLPCHPYYLGVIGSHTKLAFVREKLRNDGFSDAEIDQCYAPIGIPISAATPEEIAISIAAELIAIRARREGREKKDAAMWRSAHVPANRS